MKKKFVFGTALTFALVGMTACSATNATTLAIPTYEASTMMQLSSTPPTTTQQNIAPNEYETTEVITTVQLPATLLDDVSSRSDAEQIAFWDEFWQNNPDVLTIEFYDENGVVTMALMVSRPTPAAPAADNVYINDLDEALALHRADNLAEPTYLPDGFAFVHAWFSNFACPISNPDSDFSGGQLFVVFGNGAQHLALEIRYHPEDGGFDVWTSCENLEELTINGRNAIVGEGGLSIQVTHNVRYTFMTGGFAGLEGSTLSNEELIRIAESISLR